MGEQTPGVALAAAARVGGYAPSIHNTQPWRWRITGDLLELRVFDLKELDQTVRDVRVVVKEARAARPLLADRTEQAAVGTREIGRR